MSDLETREQREARIDRLRREQFGDDPIANAYAVYDSDPRASGPYDFEACREALLTLGDSVGRALWEAKQDAFEERGRASMEEGVRA